MPNAFVVFNELSRLLGTKALLSADKLTLADQMVAPHLDLLPQTPEWLPLTAAAPNLASWLHRMNERRSFQATTWERLAQMAKADQGQG